MKKIINILKLGRLHFLLGGYLLFTLGALTAVLTGAPADLNKYLLGYVIFALGHLAVSYSNDFFDVEADSKGERTLISGGSGILLKHPELIPFAKRFALILMSTSVLLTIPFILTYGFPPEFILLIIFGNLLGWYYSAPPIKLAYRGLGEIPTIFAMGLIMPGLGYLIMKEVIDSIFIFYSIPLLFYGVSFILTVQAPDMKADKLGGKKTFITRYGRKKAFLLVGLFFISATLYLLGASFMVDLTPVDLMILFLISLPLALVGLYELINPPVESQKTAFFSTVNITGLILSLSLMDIYLYTLL